MPRPDLLVVVAGTGTEVGKTWTTARLSAGLRGTGLQVAARKPVQSFAPGAGPTDADVLATATGCRPHDVCPAHRWYPAPMAPPMAAEALGRPAPRMAELTAELSWPAGTAVGLVECAGGLASPVAADGDSADLARAIGADLVLLVAHAGLGTISDVRLCAAAVRDLPLQVVLNRFDDNDDLHRRNLAWLAEREGLDVTTSRAELAVSVSARFRR